MAQTEQTMLEEILRIVSGILEQKGIAAHALSQDSQLLGGGLGIDSLDLAVLVTELERIAGRDPFAQGFVCFRTAGDLAKLYLRTS